MKGLVDEVKTSRTTTAKAEKEIEGRKELVSVPEKLRNNVLNDLPSSSERVAEASTREAELLPDMLAASSQIVRDIAELR